MNLIPFVLIIITILSLFSITQFESAIVQKKVTQIYTAYFKGLRETRNQKVTIAYRKTTPKRSRANNSSFLGGENKTDPPYFRWVRVGWDGGRLNLSSLILHPNRSALLKHIFTLYLKELYGHTDFFPKQGKFAELLLEELIQQYRDKEPSTPLCYLTFKSTQLQMVFYKMVRGTHTYDLEKKIGYPPFGDMFTFENNDLHSMNFHYANPCFLSCILGPQLNQAFIALEKEKLKKAKKQSVSPIQKSEFRAFLKHQRDEAVDELVALFDFVYRSSKHCPQTYKDPDTRITVKIY